jgi:hypothetical protein
MAEYNDLIAWKSRLQDALSTGVREVTDSDGSRVSYSSATEILKSLAYIESQLNAPTARSVRFVTSKFPVRGY